MQHAINNGKVVDFNEVYAASISEAAFIESNQHQYPGETEEARNQALKFIHDECCRKQGVVKPTTDDNDSSGNVTKVSGGGSGTGSDKRSKRSAGSARGLQPEATKEGQGE